MKRNIFQYAPQNNDAGPTGNQEGGESATYNTDTSKLRPEQENNSSGAGVAGTDSEGRRTGMGSGSGDTTPEMDADSSKPGTGDMSGRAGGGRENDTVTGG